MIKLTPNNITNKICKIEYENGTLNIKIYPKIYTISNSNDFTNIGTILEKYRSLQNDADMYFINNSSTIDDFIGNYKTPYDDIQPDCVVCFLPDDFNRKQLLLNFKEKNLENINNENLLDYSDKFYKLNPGKSIKNNILTKEDFIFEIQNIEPFKSILIFDDVLDEGKTLAIFLELLYDNNLIDNFTIVNFSCIYNRPKHEKIDYLSIFKN
jgi:hypothetical protein